MLRNIITNCTSSMGLWSKSVGNSNFKNSIRSYAARKRFYRKTNVLQCEGKFEVTLDQRKLKTPKGKVFSVESEPLALAVAAEWDRQETYIVPSSMHLTGLCSTVLDNPNKINKEDMVNSILKYIDTDTILYISAEKDELYDLQMKEWKPILEWFCKRFNVSLESSSDFEGPQISSDVKEAIRKHLLSHNTWAIQGYIFAIEALKSVILGLSCAERHITVERAVFLSRLEEEFQGKRWGRIEWSHELNQQDTQSRVAAGIMFAYLTSSSNFVKKKAQVI